MSEKIEDINEETKNENMVDDQWEENVDTDDVEKDSTDDQSEVDQLKEDLGKERDKFMRLFAEFENYKKRTSKERLELFKTANQDVMVSLLPVIDDFDRAYVEISKTNEKSLLKGVELISNKLRDVLKNKGLEEMSVMQGDSFDPEIHEAVTQITAPSKELKGKIIDVIEKGYKLGEKIIRYPKVVIGQ